MTQCEQILDHLRHRGSITAIEAMQRYGCNSLAARIHDLRNANVMIDSSWVTKKGRNGKKVTYRKYFLANPGE